MPRRVGEPDVEIAKKRLAINGTRLPEPIRIGEIFTDLRQNQWKLGRSIGVGGFGEIYLASDDISKPVGADAEYVIKVEPHSNGPLFVEMNFYIRAAKAEIINAWIKRHKLKRLGMPHYVGSGSHHYEGEKYRFLVQERFDEDLHKLFLRNGRRFHVKTALTLAIQIIDILEYIHSRGYIHSDIKGSNMLLGRGSELKHQVYLLDYGLAYHYVEGSGVHKEYRSDERRAHNGTIEYTSRDSHIGAGSRRGDLETLGYNLLQWLCGRLPWESNLESPSDIHEQKNALMANIPLLMKLCSSKSQLPTVLGEYLKYVAGLAFDAKPDYTLCKKLLRQGIKESGYSDNSRLEFGCDAKAMLPNKTKKRGEKRKANEEPENISPVKSKRILYGAPLRQPCVAQNCNRMTRNSPAMPVLRSTHAFSWEEIISGDPEKNFKKQPQRKITPASSPQSHMSLSSRVEHVPISSHREKEQEVISTPVMLDVMARKKRRSSSLSSNKKGRGERRTTSHISSLYPYPITAEMIRIIRRREELRLPRIAKNCDKSPDHDILEDVVYMTRLAKRRQNQSCKNIHRVKKSASALAALQKTFSSRSGTVTNKAIALAKKRTVDKSEMK